MCNNDDDDGDDDDYEEEIVMMMIVTACCEAVLGVTCRILSVENNHVAGEAWHLLMKDDCP